MLYWELNYYIGAKMLERIQAKEDNFSQLILALHKANLIDVEGKKNQALTGNVGLYTIEGFKNALSEWYTEYYNVDYVTEVHYMYFCKKLLGYLAMCPEQPKNRRKEILQVVNADVRARIDAIDQSDSAYILQIADLYEQLNNKSLNAILTLWTNSKRDDQKIKASLKKIPLTALREAVKDYPAMTEPNQKNIVISIMRAYAVKFIDRDTLEQLKVSNNEFTNLYFALVNHVTDREPLAEIELQPTIETYNKNPTFKDEIASIADQLALESAARGEESQVWVPAQLFQEVLEFTASANSNNVELEELKKKATTIKNWMNNLIFESTSGDKFNRLLASVGIILSAALLVAAVATMVAALVTVPQAIIALPYVSSAIGLSAGVKATVAGICAVGLGLSAYAFHKNCDHSPDVKFEISNFVNNQVKMASAK